MNENVGSYALPGAFTEKMKRLLGDEYGAFMKSYDESRVQGLRFNGCKGDPAEMEAENRERFGLSPVPWCREGFYYSPQTRPGRHPFHEAGVYYIQEPSAMAVVSLLDPKPGERALDLCAAPGGKTTQIGGRLRGDGLLVSNEIHPARAKILSQNVERMGIANAVVTNESSGALSRRFPGFFDCIVVDAPCSGEGMFRKDEQARAQWSEEAVKLCAARQQEILDDAALMLRPGGRMVYSTCTFSPEEDEEGIASFLERHPEFSIVQAPGERKLPGLQKARPEWSKKGGPELSGAFRIWPHRAAGEGHFLALLTKTGEQNGGQKYRAPKFFDDREALRLLMDFFEETLTPAGMEALGLETGGEKNLVLFGDQLYRVPGGTPDLDGLRVLRPGLHLGTLKKKRFEPSHALALFLKPDMVKQSVSYPADGREIAEYLKGGTLPQPEGMSGWVLVCVERYSLGWAKAAAGTLKNHYPKGLRIG